MKKFIIQKDKWINICNENILVCGVSFGVSFKSNGIGIFEITVNSTNITNSDDNDNNKINNNNLTWYFLIGSGAALFCIVLVLVYFYKRKSKREHFSNTVDSTLSQGERLMYGNEN